jgi:hypothetical protein
VASMAHPQTKAKHMLATIEAMQRPEVRAKMGKNNDPANAARAAKVRALWADPLYKAERARKMIEANANPEVIAKRSAAAKKQYADGGFNAVLAKAHEATSKRVTLSKGDEVRHFNCINDAALFLEVNRSTVGRYAAGDRKRKTEINGWSVAIS